jgi:hypothetical protein
MHGSEKGEKSFISLVSPPFLSPPPKSTISEPKRYKSPNTGLNLESVGSESKDADVAERRSHAHVEGT